MVRPTLKAAERPTEGPRPKRTLGLDAYSDCKEPVSSRSLANQGNGSRQRVTLGQ